jgi:hypothetical protein
LAFIFLDFAFCTNFHCSILPHNKFCTVTVPQNLSAS